MIKWVSAFSWELPQTILGILGLLFFFISRKAQKISIEGDKVIIYMTFTSWNHSSDSMGHFVFFNVENYSKYIRRHEFGHSVQSMYFGWLYLFAIIIPSLYGWILCKIGKRSWNTYYKYYPENWANSLGGNK